MSARPDALPVRTTGIPAELRMIPQWVGWDWSWRKDKWTKPPVNVRNGTPASSTDARTWAPFGAAVRYARANDLPGVGLVLTHEAGLVGVDLDRCYDGTTIEPWALQIIARFGSYTEVSPSGTGFRIMCWADLPCDGARKGPVEIYQAGRYVTITGHNLDEIDGVVPAQDACDWLLGYLGWEPPQERPAMVWGGLPAGSIEDRLANAPIRRDTRALLDNTGPAQYPSASEADSAIACALIGAGFSADETMAIIAGSVRGADICRRKRGRHADYYLRRTVEHAAAFASPREVYGIRVVERDAARVARSLTYVHDIHDFTKREFREFVNNVSTGDK